MNNNTWLHIADVVFYTLHVLIILFNLFGWIRKTTRGWHLVVILLTAASWFILGIWYGFGYCFLTDWHWNIKNRLGEHDLPNSFITYFFQSINMPISPATADTLAVSGFALALILSIWLNIRLALQKKRGKTKK